MVIELEDAGFLERKRKKSEEEESEEDHQVQMTGTVSQYISDNLDLEILHVS